MAAAQRRDWLRYFPALALGTVLAALATLAIFHHWLASVLMSGIRRHRRKSFSEPNIGTLTSRNLLSD
jgi:hypothetical protein